MKVVLVACALLASVAVAHADDTRVTRTVLPNGLRVLVRENPAAGVVAVSLLVRAGSRFETADNAGITNFLHRVMVRGTMRRSALEIATTAEELGGSVDAVGDVEYAEIRGTALARHWEPLLALVADVALHPTLPADAIQLERRLILSQIQSRLDAPFQHALDTLVADLYGDHPYSLAAVGRKTSVERLSREDLLAHYRTVFQPDRLVLAVSGRVPPAQVVAAARKIFGGMSSAPGAASDPRAPIGDAPPATPGGGRRVLDRPAHQAQVLVGFVGPGATDPDYAAVKVMSAVLGGGMAGRFFVELRDRLGLAYSTGMINPTRAGPAFVVGYLGTVPASADEAEVALLRELARSRAEPPTPEELARAKAYAIGTVVMDRRTNAREAWYLAFFEAIGAGYDFPSRYARLADAVTAADVQRVARRYLERPTIVILRPRP